jgi:hypothetical protein
VLASRRDWSEERLMTRRGRREAAGLAAALMLAGCEAKTTRQPEPAPEPPRAGERTYPPGGTAPGTTPRQDADLQVVFQWPLYVARTGQRARESAVGYVRADGTSGGVILINAEGAVIQPIPGTQGPDAAEAARRWLMARGWEVR